MKTDKFKKIIREGAVMLVSIALVVFIFRWANAGSLTPTAVPAGTMKTLTEIFDPLASNSYDSSAVTADSNGNAFEIVKCIYQKISTGSCP